MAIVDERGRLFGRWNLLDFALLVLVAGLIPLGYAGYLLFRDQPPRLVGVTPNQVAEAGEYHLTVKGENLRPYMRISAGTQQARDFQFKSTEEARIQLPYLAPGTYDIVLYDQASERFRLPKALIISPSGLPTTEVIAIGAFGNLDAAGAQKLTAGTALPQTGRIESVGRAIPDLTQVFSGSKMIGVAIKDALRLPAVVRFTCSVSAQAGSPYCRVGEVVIAPNAFLILDTPLGKTPFQVERVRSTVPVEAMRIEVRLAAPPSVLSLIKAGDVDLGGTTNELALVARVAATEPVRVVGPNAAEMTVSLIAELQRAEQQWLYDSAPLRAGTKITLRTSRYEAAGVVTQAPPPDAAASK
jgi:hypothetical protein